MLPWNLLLSLWPLLLGAAGVGTIWFLLARFRYWRERARVAESRARSAAEALSLSGELSAAGRAIEDETQSRLARHRREQKAKEEELRDVQSAEEVAELANRWFGAPPAGGSRLRGGEEGGDAASHPPGARTPPGGEPPPPA